jgi:hypothetical protein
MNELYAVITKDGNVAQSAKDGVPYLFKYRAEALKYCNRDGDSVKKVNVFIKATSGSEYLKIK